MAHPKEVLADIFEKTADYIEALEASNAEYARRSSLAASKKRDKVAAKVATAYEHATGKSLPPELVSAIAENPKLAAAVQELVAAETPATLGAAVARDKVARVNQPEDADEAFLNFLLKE